MTDIIIHGCGGKMGHAVYEAVKSDPACRIVAGIDPMAGTMAFPVFTSLDSCHISADVIIDFSTAAAVPNLVDFCEKTKTPVVLCTTGVTEDTAKRIHEAANNVAILKSANMSIGVNLLISLVTKAAAMLAGSGFDIEIIEKHHNQKIDAPSGTALAIADAINDELDNTLSYVYDRSIKREKREKTEIGIHSLRGGTIVGEHEVIFAGTDEILEITHKAMSKEIFAVGAVKAAKFLSGKAPMLYTMKDIMD